jgi:hypothetical protein
LRKRESPVLPGEKKRTEHIVGTGGVCQQREDAFLFQVPLKPTLPHRRAGPGGSHPIMNKWGGVRLSSQPGESGLALPQATYMNPKLPQ